MHLSPDMFSTDRSGINKQFLLRNTNQQLQFTVKLKLFENFEDRINVCWKKCVNGAIRALDFYDDPKKQNANHITHWVCLFVANDSILSHFKLSCRKLQPYFGIINTTQMLDVDVLTKAI